MSCSKFELRFRPDPLWQLGVAAIAATAALSGLIIIVTLPLTAAWPILAFSWLLYCVAEAWHWWRGCRALKRLRASHAGGWRGLFQNGLWQPLEIADGSVVSTAFVWLRLRSARGHYLATALSRRSLSPDDWRRLQVLLRLG